MLIPTGSGNERQPCYHVTWDSCADAPGLQITNLTYTVTANMAKYMVVDLSKGKDGPFPISYYEDVPSFPGVEAGKWDDYHKTTNLVLRLIQPGTYKQGWTDSTSTNTKREGYSHTATLTKPFYIAVFEMTQEQFLLINGTWTWTRSSTTSAATSTAPAPRR